MKGVKLNDLSRFMDEQRFPKLPNRQNRSGLHSEDVLIFYDTVVDRSWRRGDVVKIDGLAGTPLSVQDAYERYLSKGLELSAIISRSLDPGVSYKYATLLEDGCAKNSPWVYGKMPGVFGSLIGAESTDDESRFFARHARTVEEEYFGTLTQCYEGEAEYRIIASFSGGFFQNENGKNVKKTIFAVLVPYNTAGSSMVSGLILPPEGNAFLCEPDDSGYSVAQRIDVPDGFWGGDSSSSSSSSGSNSSPDKTWVVIKLDGNLGYIRLGYKWTNIIAYIPNSPILYNRLTRTVVAKLHYSCYGKLAAAITSESTYATVAIKYTWNSTTYTRNVYADIPEPICALGSYEIPVDTLVTLQPANILNSSENRPFVLANIWGSPVYPDSSSSSSS